MSSCNYKYNNNNNSYLAISGPNRARYYFAWFGPTLKIIVTREIINASLIGQKQAYRQQKIVLGPNQVAFFIPAGPKNAAWFGPRTIYCHDSTWVLISMAFSLAIISYLVVFQLNSYELYQPFSIQIEIHIGLVT